MALVLNHINVKHQNHLNRKYVEMKFIIFGLCTLCYCIWIFFQTEWLTYKHSVSAKLQNRTCQLPHLPAIWSTQMLVILPISYAAAMERSLMFPCSLLLLYSPPTPSQLCQPAQITCCCQKMSVPLFWWMEWLGAWAWGSFCSLSMTKAQFWRCS